MTGQLIGMTHDDDSYDDADNDDDDDADADDER